MTKKFRIEVLSALKAYESIQKLDASGESPMYRSREWRRQHSSREKWQKQDKWYKKGGYESVIFIAATPNSTLKRQYNNKRLNGLLKTNHLAARRLNYMIFTITILY